MTAVSTRAAPDGADGADLLAAGLAARPLAVLLAAWLGIGCWALFTLPVRAVVAMLAGVTWGSSRWQPHVNTSPAER
ncbi:hypothetical protein HUT19_35040 [Streptomyces sp. NA02950]|uniref:hypothetical protein n=1 Tax=Streptomyces sp. NA02950 TaxID=2742137 RepID=UPI00159097D1|nr:hypothetical protein [Streptomyces sp. NA02950]QKV96292.1 hypothetical protein HUT19_35040 [Streptomyces sp. NA02950]